MTIRRPNWSKPGNPPAGPCRAWRLPGEARPTPKLVKLVKLVKPVKMVKTVKPERACGA